MRPIFQVLGTALALVFVTIGSVVAYAAWKAPRLDAESKAYVRQVIVDVGGTWDKSELIRRASPRLLTVSSPEQIAALFQQLAKFGRLLHYDGAHGQATLKLALIGDLGVTAHYDANATFMNGQAHFQLDLSKDHERWMIDGFHIQLPAPEAPTATSAL